jgi:hypothetical protein
VTPLQSRLAQSSSEVLRHRYGAWAKVGLGELGGAVATRLCLIQRASYRLSKLVSSLRDQIDATDEIDAYLDDGYAFPQLEEAIYYDICLAVDAFFFEFRSCYEVMGKFVTIFCEQMLCKNISEKQLRAVLVSAELDTRWIEPLRMNRITFFHNTAPWIALEIHRRKPLKCSILVMKENLHKFDDPDKYITQSQMANTANGFQETASAVQKWLDEQVTEFEALTNKGSAL